jgi:hypothetical protein
MKLLQALLALFACAFLPLHAASLADLTYATTDGKISITNCDTAAKGKLVIPDTIDGKPVTKIGGDTFRSCASLTSITFQGTAPTVGWEENRGSAFTNVADGAVALVTIEELTSFGASGADWNGLTVDTILTWTTTNEEVSITDCDEAATGELIIPDTIGGKSVTSIGTFAFYKCTGLTSITIPDGVNSIGESSFERCTSLTMIEVGAENLNYTGIDGVLFNKEKTVLHTYPAGKTGDNYAIPDGVTSIGEWAFELCTSLTSITIPDGVTSIGEWAFELCTSLPSITIPDSVTSIGDYAFYECPSLTSITIGNGVTSIGQAAFASCLSLTSITIPDGVTSIRKTAFYNCTSLTSITIPDGVTSIGESAFEFCINLTSITIPDSVTSIGDRAFKNCTSLTSITFLGTAPTVGTDAFSGVANGAEALVTIETLRFFGESGDDWNGLTVSRVSQLEVQLAQMTAERDAAIAERDTRPTAELLATVEAERDARPTQESYDALIAALSLRPTQASFDAVKADRDARPTIGEVKDARLGSVVLQPDGANNNITIRFSIEETDDFRTWTKRDQINEVTVPLEASKRFYRFALENE